MIIATVTEYQFTSYGYSFSILCYPVFYMAIFAHFIITPEGKSMPVLSNINLSFMSFRLMGKHSIRR